MAFWSWSKTAATNATADTTVNWAEGQAPSSVNDSARAMMARIAEFRDDIAGAIVTAGSSTAYTVASNQVFDTLAHLNGQMIAFTPHATNGDTVTLNVDGLGAKPLRSAPSVELVAGTLVLGTPYLALYNNSDAAFYLRGYFSSPYNVPFLGGLDFWDTVTPNSSFIFPAGQAISRTVYSRAFARWGTTYGAGDGSTTFNVPDKTGRVSAMKESSATRLTTAVGGVDGATMGAVAPVGAQGQTLSLSQLPGGLTSSGSNLITVGSTDTDFIRGGLESSNATGGTETQIKTTSPAPSSKQVVSTGTISINVTSNNTGGLAHPNVQPTIVCNYILRII